MNLLESIEQRVVLGDGALGTQLLLGERSWKDCLEFINVERPEEVHDLHRRYLDAGAEIIETNSFGANRVRLARHRLADRVNEINWQAAQIARQAAQGYPALVAGSVGPLGLSADEAQHHGIDRLEVYLEQIGALLDGGAQAIFLESFSDENELLIALEAKQTLHHCPVVSMLSCDPSGFLPSGLPLEEALLRLLEQGSDMVGINCLSGPQATLRLLQRLPAHLPLAAFPNAGSPAIMEGKLSFDASPEYFAQAAEAMVAEGAKLIGGCCGIGPEHIKAAKARVRGLP
ncbi:MAG: homocysteine S-methyltransferase family protein, partial [Verrucomicrobiales bacterium]